MGVIWQQRRPPATRRPQHIGRVNLLTCSLPVCSTKVSSGNHIQAACRMLCNSHRANKAREVQCQYPFISVRHVPRGVSPCPVPFVCDVLCRWACCRRCYVQLAVSGCQRLSPHDDSSHLNGPSVLNPCRFSTRKSFLVHSKTS